MGWKKVESSSRPTVCCGFREMERGRDIQGVVTVTGSGKFLETKIAQVFRQEDSDVTKTRECVHI